MRHFIMLILAIFIVMPLKVLASEEEYFRGLEAARAGNFNLAMEIWLPLAKDGDPSAQNMIGVLYQRGDGVAKSLPTAVNWFRLAAGTGHPEALYTLGLMHLYGDGLSQQVEKSIEYITEAADGGYSLAQYQLGMLYQFGNEQTKDILQTDLKKAYYYYKLAADQEDSNAEYAIGRMFYLGEGVEKDLSAALEWYGRSAKQYNMYAQYALGVLHHFGESVPKNLKVAEQWYQLAANQGMKEAEKALKNLRNRETPNLAKNIANFDNRSDMVSLKEAFKKGDYPKSFELASGLSSQGITEAQLILGSLYEEGLGTLQLTKNAYMWYNIAAMQGDEHAISKRNFLASKLSTNALEDAQKMSIICVQSNLEDCGLTMRSDKSLDVQAAKVDSELRFLSQGAQLKIPYNAQSKLLRKQLQYALKELGLYTSSIDGIWGRRTDVAFTNYLKLNEEMFSDGTSVFNDILSKVPVPNSFASANRTERSDGANRSQENKLAESLDRLTRMREAEMLMDLGLSLMNPSTGSGYSNFPMVTCSTSLGLTTCY